MVLRLWAFLPVIKAVTASESDTLPRSSFTELAGVLSGPTDLTASSDGLSSVMHAYPMAVVTCSVRYMDPRVLCVLFASVLQTASH